MAKSGSDDPWEYSLRKYLLLLATLVATVTYAAGFNPPGGVWQDTDPTTGHLAGDPIIRDTSYFRYLAFFYCNATAFASSLIVIVLILILSILHDRGSTRMAPVRCLRVVMTLDLLSLMGAYAAGTCRDSVTPVYSSVLVLGVVGYVAIHMVLATRSGKKDDSPLERLRKVLMLLATFAVSVTYLAGLSAPGGFSFVASLLIIVLVLDKELRKSDKVRSIELYGFIFVALVGLVGAYSAGSCREIYTTIYVNCLADKQCRHGCDKACQLVGEKTFKNCRAVVTMEAAITYQAGPDPPGGIWESDGDGYMAGDPVLLTTNPRRFKAFFYCNSVAFVASLVAIILVRKKTLHQHNALEAAMILDLFGLIGAYAAGSCRDVRTSIYAVALAGAVLVYVVIHVLFFTLDHEDRYIRGNDEASIRKQKDADDLLEKRLKRLLLFAILAATITYQAGLTRPSGFRLQDDDFGHQAGDPVLLYNFPRRYKAFFYCNSVSFMLSIALIILLVNKNLYRPAIESNALSVCTAAGMLGLMGGYAAGSTQYLRTSIYIFALTAVVLVFVVLLIVIFLVIHTRQEDEDNAQNRTTAETADQENGTAAESCSQIEDGEGKKLHAKRKYLMLLGILVASITYQAGLEPPGGVWQNNADGHEAGNPIMYDNRRPRYLAFF
ncbi:hypothetical protein PR202_ga03537 [Eleusine coracana subsp. coracana]|uniref:PGG domain-containing protein n=1 Tax=Eleusine coracana subsp. coracana TaxID=191504 RepID=A0AAV5BML6_ELECO|nr:hypothetical protein PR202_ga03537 [Eleusine coracana subsp. coracana]